jgi:RNA polymerase sigma-70 factor (ECF subfamily)
MTSAPTPFESTLLPHLQSAYNLARWLLRHDQDAEDAVQDACLRAHEAFSRFRGGDGRGWLLTIVRNVCYSRLRRRPGGGPGEAELEFDEEIHGAADPGAETREVEWREARAEVLRQALDRLPAPAREIIVLREIEGLSYREVASVIETPIGTVMSRLARARTRLQEEVAKLLRNDPESSHRLR